jgi:hypothetical protein
LKNRVWCALRDWRVWALVLTVQGPGVRAVVRYAPWPALPLVFIVSIAAYGLCLHGPFARWTRYVPTYLGNAPGVGPGWAAVVSPLAVTGTYALLTPLALTVLAWTVRRSGGWEAGTLLALLLPLTSPVALSQHRNAS